jgi:CRISPR-associated protein Cas5d
MLTAGRPLKVKVWGDFACFTKPEMKVERVSYPCLTPSAARGVLEAIFWKPQFTWRVRSIDVLRPLRYFSVVRNEVTRKSSVRSMTLGDVINVDDDRAQRHTLALRDVAYVIRADIELRQHARAEDPAKFRDQFRRRVASGRCFRQPYLGCREFAAYFGEPDDEPPEAVDVELGAMLLDVEFPNGVAGPGRPIFFDARLQRGRLTVPNDPRRR